MSSENKSTVAMILDLVREIHPERIDGLVQELYLRIAMDERKIIKLLQNMVQSGDIAIKYPGNMPRPHDFLAKHVFLKKVFVEYAKETTIKALAFVIVVNLLSWIIITYFENSVILMWSRIAILGIAFLFLPGFSIVIEWYPFPSRVLDFNRLKRANGSHPSKEGDMNMKNSPDFLTRVGFSICYSLGLMVLLGFLIGLLNYGFNIVILNGCFTVIEILVILDVLFKIRKLNDPFLAI